MLHEQQQEEEGSMFVHLPVLNSKPPVGFQARRATVKHNDLVSTRTARHTFVYVAAASTPLPMVRVHLLL